MRISFIIKETSKNRKLASLLIKESKKINLFDNIIVSKTEFAGHAIQLAEKHASDGIEIIAALGGDGTLNEVLNGIMKVKRNKSILTHFPLGTANDFSYSIGLEKNVNQFLKSIIVRKIITPDVGKVTCEINGGESVRYFLNVADAGLGGFVAHKLTNSKKWLGGKITYFKVIAQGVLTFKKPIVSIKIDNIDFHGKLMTLAVCNGKSFGNGLIIAPEAKINDGKFNITLIGNVTILDYLKNLKNLKRGIKMKHKSIYYHIAEKITIESNEQFEVELDGEYMGAGKTTFELLQNSLQMIYPLNN